MTPLQISDVSSYIEEHISTFHEKRIRSLDSLKLSSVLQRKNPYLFKVKDTLTAEQIVQSLLNAHISSHEETIFGDWLEGLAIFINNKVYQGWKSGITGIDLEFSADDIRYIVAIKSGPNWGNSSQIAKMKTDFSLAKKTLRTSGSGIQIVAVNGCCYGKDNRPDKGGHFKYCGQAFWKFISNDNELFTKIIDPLGYAARKKNDAFTDSYAQVVNVFTMEFANQFCTPTGKIDWEQLVRFNSSAATH